MATILHENTDLARQQFLKQLQDIWGDPQVRKLAQKWAGDLGLADDALNQAWEAVARRGPDGIQNLRAYYCRTLINTAIALRQQLILGRAQAFEEIAEGHQGNALCQQLSRPVDEMACSRALSETWLAHFAAQHDNLTTKVARRSPDAEKYRAVIVTVAGRVLDAIVAEDLSDADSNSELIAAYPEWFAEPGCSRDTSDQRFCRARRDVRNVLQNIVKRGDL